MPASAMAAMIRSRSLAPGNPVSIMAVWPVGETYNAAFPPSTSMTQISSGLVVLVWALMKVAAMTTTASENPNRFICSFPVLRLRLQILFQSLPFHALIRPASGHILELFNATARPGDDDPLDLVASSDTKGDRQLGLRQIARPAFNHASLER